MQTIKYKILRDKETKQNVAITSDGLVLTGILIPRLFGEDTTMELLSLSQSLLHGNDVTEEYLNQYELVDALVIIEERKEFVDKNDKDYALDAKDPRDNVDTTSEV